MRIRISNQSLNKKNPDFNHSVSSSYKQIRSPKQNMQMPDIRGCPWNFIPGNHQIICNDRKVDADEPVHVS
jgi:hypothetical protein